jgi:hypothetical protein
MRRLRIKLEEEVVKKIERDPWRVHEVSGDVFLDFLRWRIKNNKNIMMSITGEMGSGKSYSALGIAERFDPDFNVDRVVFDPLSYIDAVGSIPPGGAVVFDEAGTSLSARLWHSVGNILLNFINQTIRYKRQLIIFTVPLESFIDIQARRLIFLKLTTVDILKRRRLCVLKPLYSQYNEQFRKEYRKYLMLNVGVPAQLVDIKVKMPSLRLRRAYEAKRRRMIREMQREIREKIEAELSRGRKIDYDAIVDEVLKNLDDYVKKWGKREIISLSKIQSRHAVGYTAALRIREKVLEQLKK